MVPHLLFTDRRRRKKAWDWQSFIINRYNSLSNNYRESTRKGKKQKPKKKLVPHEFRMRENILDLRNTHEGASNFIRQMSTHNDNLLFDENTEI